MKKKLHPKNTETREIDLESGAVIKPRELDLSKTSVKGKGKSDGKKTNEKGGRK